MAASGPSGQASPRSGRARAHRRRSADRQGRCPVRSSGGLEGFEEWGQRVRRAAIHRLGVDLDASACRGSSMTGRWRRSDGRPPAWGLSEPSGRTSPKWRSWSLHRRVARPRAPRRSRRSTTGARRWRPPPGRRGNTCSRCSARTSSESMTWVQVLLNACHSQVVVGWPECGAGAELLHERRPARERRGQGRREGHGVGPSASAPKFR